MRRWVESLITAQVDGGALANSSTATSLLPAAAKKRLDAGFLQIGRKLIIRAHGRISTLVTTPGTLTFEVRFTGSPDATSPTTVVVASGGAMTLSTTAKTNVAWSMQWDLTCRAIGASANLMHQGAWVSEAAGATTVAGEAKAILLPQSAPAVGNNFDSTQIQVVDLFGTWSTPSASNSIQLQGYELISEN